MGVVIDLKQGFLKKNETLDFANIAVLKLSIDDAVNETLEELENDPDVEAVIPNYVFEFDSAPNDPYYDPAEGTDQWGLKTIQVAQAWDEMPENPDE